MLELCESILGVTGHAHGGARRPHGPGPNRQVIELLEPSDYVVLPSGSCAGMLIHHYPRLLDGEWRQQGLGDAYEAVKQGMEAKSPLGRVTTPDEIATAIVSVVSGTDLVTGHVLPVEGGMLIGG